MKSITTLVGCGLLAVMLSACSPGIHELGHSITFDSNGMVVHAKGQPNAYVSRNGDLRIGDHAIAVTPAQRQLLKQYYAQADGVLHSGVAMGKQSAEMAARGIGTAIASIFHGDSSAAEKKMDAQSQDIEVAAAKLCSGVRAIGTTQDTIAVQIPAFKPYASGDQMQCRITHTVTIRDNGTATTGAAASAPATSARPSPP